MYIAAVPQALCDCKAAFLAAKVPNLAADFTARPLFKAAPPGINVVTIEGELSAKASVNQSKKSYIVITYII